MGNIGDIVAQLLAGQDTLLKDSDPGMGSITTMTVPESYRRATYGGPTWGGGVYDLFRRSDNIEDRRGEMHYRTLSYWADEAEKARQRQMAASLATDVDRRIREEGSPFPVPPPLGDQ